jgi:protein-L-isoaspartate(D-aspartate) O-methyltransferase
MSHSKPLQVFVIGLFVLTLSFVAWGKEVKSFTEEEETVFEQRRKIMVESTIKSRGVTDPKVLAAMEKVKRHLFIERALKDVAYADGPLPIGYGQTISQPYVVAVMTELLDLKEGDKVLEVGTGSGYQAAVLAEIIKEVYTIEIIKELGELARERLEPLGYGNVKVEIGDGYYGLEQYAPFDGIIVTAAATHIPPPLLEQLKSGGKMVIPVGPVFHVQYLMLVEKREDGSVIQHKIMPVRFVPLTGGEGK